ncbi:Glutathione amide reductase [Nymphon striatum]|nr:Glutathione amide reductase [Nymphon striatum]
MSKHYDLISIGAGSGGLSIAERAASYGAKTAVIESSELGGTCVNVGCVPKKVMWYGAGVAQGLKDAQDYGFNVDLEGDGGKLNWEKLVMKRENFIGGILDWYDGYMGEAGVDVINGRAKFINNNTLSVDGEMYTADRYVIATGGRPIFPTDIPGARLGIDSDGFFQDLDEVQPQKVVVVGGGYIALELAMLMDGLGSDVSVLHQGWPVLEGFDGTIQKALRKQMEDDNIALYDDEIISSVEEQEDSSAEKKLLTIHFEDGTSITDVEALIWAIGRKPNTDAIGLENTEVRLDARGMVIVDDEEKTTVDNIYAIGDIIAEEKAKETYGDDVKVYQTDFVPLYHQMTRHKVKTHMKLIVLGEEEKVIGCHVIGLGADEMLQGFAVAIRMGATKADFD